MKLVSPHLNYQRAFANFYQDFVTHDPDNAAYYEPSQHDFGQYVLQLNDQARGIGLPPGYVPCNHFWLVDDEERVIGAIRIRHHMRMTFCVWNVVISVTTLRHHIVEKGPGVKCCLLLCNTHAI